MLFQYLQGLQRFSYPHKLMKSQFSTEDGPGIRTTVFLKGCPLSCRWCHNPELIEFGPNVFHNKTHCIGCGACISACKSKALISGPDGITIDRSKCKHCLSCTKVCYSGALKIVGEEKSVDEVMELVIKDKGFYQKTNGGLTISGGELLSQPDFSMSLEEAAIREDIQVILDTSGFGNGDKLLAMAENAQNILYDMKNYDNDAHIKCTGQENGVILNNLEKLCQDSEIRKKIIMRMPLIHDVNDQLILMKRTAYYYYKLGIIHVNLIAYHELGKAKAACVGRQFEVFNAPSSEYLQQLKDLYKEYVSDVEIVGEGV